MNRRVLVNGRFLAARTTGVQRYAGEVLARRSATVDVRVVSPTRPLGKLSGHLWEQFRLPWLRAKNEILWSPANTGPLAVADQVVTVYDATTLDHPEWFDPSFVRWYRFLLPRLMRRVRRVITISEFSRTRLLEQTAISPDRITVIPPGVAGRFCPARANDIAQARRRLNLPETYILTVGSLEPRKNLAALLQAWDSVRPMAGTAQLVVAGSEGRVFRGAGFNQTTDGVQWLGYVGDDDLPALYSGALAFVYPTLYEGFGLPVLEAMACGTPVVCSNATAVPEAAGDAAVLVNPSSAEAIAVGLARVIQDAGLRTELRRKGLDRVRQFTWERTAESTWRVLQEVGANS